MNSSSRFVASLSLVTLLLVCPGQASADELRRVINGQPLTPAVERWAEDLARRLDAGQATIETVEWRQEEGPPAVGARVRFADGTVVERVAFPSTRAVRVFRGEARELLAGPLPRALGMRANEVVLVTRAGLDYSNHMELLDEAWEGLPSSRSDRSNSFIRAEEPEGDGLPLPTTDADDEERVAASPPRRSPARDEAGAAPGIGQPADGPRDGLATFLDGSRGDARRPRGERLGLGGYEALVGSTRRHDELIEERGYGLFYGDHGSFKRKDFSERVEWLRERVTDDTDVTRRANHPREMSCIGWALENVGRAYEAAGEGDRWAAIRRRVVADGSRGNILARELRADGWQVLYWNPDVFHPEDGNGEHPASARQVMTSRDGRRALRRGGSYNGPLGAYYSHMRSASIQVDGLVINYAPSYHLGDTRLDTSGIERLRQVPFWFGLAKGGTHTFVGHGDVVSEFHWTAAPDAPTPSSIEERRLADFPWNSGVIVVPPGTWSE